MSFQMKVRQWGGRKEEDRCARGLLEVSVDQQHFISLKEISF